jgi:hypothetical protein
VLSARRGSRGGRSARRAARRCGSRSGVVEDARSSHRRARCEAPTWDRAVGPKEQSAGPMDRTSRQAAHRQRVPLASAMRGVAGNPLVAPGKAAAVVAARGAFPFDFARQAQPTKAREGVRLVPTHADDGLVGIEIRAPGFVVPEARLHHAARFAPRPAFVGPDGPIGVASSYEVCELGVGHRRLSDLVRRRLDQQPRVLVVRALGRIAPHPESACRDSAEPHAPRVAGRWPGAAVCVASGLGPQTSGLKPTARSM